MTKTLRPHPLALALVGLASVAMPGVRTAAAADLKLEMSLGMASAHLDHPSAQFGQYHGFTRDKNAVFGNLKLRETQIYFPAHPPTLCPWYKWLIGNRWTRRT